MESARDLDMIRASESVEWPSIGGRVFFLALCDVFVPKIKNVFW